MRKAIRASFVTRVGIAAAALAFAVALGAGVISYSVTGAQLKLILRNQIDSRARIIATHLGNELMNLVENLSESAGNTLFANALADSDGRDNYLRPYLHSFLHVGPIPVWAVLSDFQGNPLETNAGQRLAELDREMLRRTVNTGRPGLRLDPAPNDVFLTLCWPVLYANTGLPEGSLAYQFALSALTDDIFTHDRRENFRLYFEKEAGKSQLALNHGTPPPERPIFLRVPVRAPKGFIGATLIVEVWEDEAELRTALWRLARSYILLGLLGLAVIVPVSLGGARWMLARLRALEAVARNVVQTGSLQQRFPREGEDEIASLAEAFNQMLADLDQAYEALKNEANREIRLQSDRFKRVLSATLEGYVRIDLSTARIEEVNDAFCGMTGHECEIWEGKPAPGFLAPLLGRAEAAAKATAWTEEGAIPGYGGREISVLTHCSVDIDAEDNRQLVVFLTDISDRKSAEARLRSVNERLNLSVSALEKRDRQMTLLNRMNDLLLAAQKKEEIYEVVRITAARLFPDTAGALSVLDPNSRMFYRIVTWGQGGVMAPRFSMDECWGIRQGRLHELTDPDAGMLCSHLLEKPRHGSACMPLMVQGRTQGLLWSEIPHQSEEELEGARRLIISMGDAIKMSISNLELREALHDQAIRDPLTGLYNRRYFSEVIGPEISRAQRAGQPLALGMIDLDHFKSLNDRFGHDAGDRVLVEMGRQLRSDTRESDIAFRFGGEEFVLLMPATDLPGARTCLEGFRQRIESARIHHGGQFLGTITMSGGVAQFPIHGQTGDDLIRSADQALYLAKASGRNQVRGANEKAPAIPSHKE